MLVYSKELFGLGFKLMRGLIASFVITFRILDLRTVSCVTWWAPPSNLFLDVDFCSVESAAGRAVFALDEFCSSCAGLSKCEAVLRAGPVHRSGALRFSFAVLCSAVPISCSWRCWFWAPGFCFPPSLLSLDPSVFRETHTEQLSGSSEGHMWFSPLGFHHIH